MMLDDLHWIATPDIPLDYRGPASQPYEPLGDPATSPPILDVFTAIATRYPDRVAVIDPETTLTFGALIHAAAQLRDDIERSPAGEGAVGILLPTGARYIIAVLGALAAGRIAVLLDAAFPTGRNRTIAGQTNIGLLLSDPNHTASWQDIATLHVDTVRERSGPYDVAPLTSRLDMDAPAFILCTSGSSGQPKAIVHSQRTMLHWARVTHDAMHVSPDDRIIAQSSFSALGGISGMLAFLLGGASNHVLHVRTVGLAGLLEMLRTSPVSILAGAPSLLRGLARLPDARDAFARLRIVRCYGEPLLHADVHALAHVLPARCLVRTTYASTEASGMTWYAGADDAHDPVRVAAGTLLPDTMAAIVDDDGCACQPGEAGELLIRSRYNALGEWIDGAVVAGRLEPHPSGDGTRVYRTGDVARVHNDGVFVVLGRKDRMVKINGQRLEPAEVEAVLRRVPGVAQADVVVQHYEQSAKLIAFVVPAGEAREDLVAGCRAMVRTALPAFMMPSKIIVIPAIPLLPGGKVDSIALLGIADRAVGTFRE